MITEWQDDPWLTVPVALGLAAASEAPQPAPACCGWQWTCSRQAWTMMTCSPTSWTPPASPSCWPRPGGIAVAVGLDHPHTRQVLRLLVDHLDDRAPARQLRRALPTGKPRRTMKTRPSAFPLPGL
jgi:hypothetical protein